MKRINDYELDCFTLKVMALTVNKSWGTEHFKKVIECAEKCMSVQETAKEIDTI